MKKMLRTVGGDGSIHDLTEPMIRHTTGKNRDVGVHSDIAPFPYFFEPTFHRSRLSQPQKVKKRKRIFVCSMADLFGEWVPDEWIEAVFAACRKAPQHDYLFLTKNPARYGKLAGEGKLPDAKNFWYGTTATNHQMAESASRYLPATWRYNLYLSMEPLQGAVNLSAMEQYPKWLIIGGMTGPGSKHKQPRYEWVADIVAWASARNIPVFMKGNLGPTWGGDLIKEHPAGMLWPEEAEG